MAHEFEQGFSVRQPAWHGLATVLDEYPGREEAIRIAGHDYTVEERRVFCAPAAEGGDPVDVPGHKALVRGDTGAFLSVVKDSYQPIQNEVMWDVLEQLVDEPNVKYETAGVLRGGTVLWAMAKLDEPVQIKGDTSPIFPYVSVSTSHDAQFAMKAMCVNVRIVCMNTYNAAEKVAGMAGTSFSFRHTKNVTERIEDAKMALGLVRGQHHAFIELCNELADLPVSRLGAQIFIDKLVPMPPVSVASARLKSNVEQGRRDIMNLMQSSVTIPEAHRHTAYGLFCAGTEYMDHLRKFMNEETYFRRVTLDTQAGATKARMAKLARECAEVR